MAMPVVTLHIAQRVVHPAHVPLHAEAQAVGMHGARYPGPGRGLFGDHVHVGELGVDGAVEVLQKPHGFPVLVPTIGVGYPFTGLAREVQVEHG